MLQKLLVLFKSLKFLESLCYVIAAVIVVFVPQYIAESGAILLVLLGVLKLFGVKPELQSRGLLPKAKKGK